MSEQNLIDKDPALIANEVISVPTTAGDIAQITREDFLEVVKDLRLPGSEPFRKALGTLADQVSAMMSAQKMYFREKSTINLQEAKREEKKTLDMLSGAKNLINHY